MQRIKKSKKKYCIVKKKNVCVVNEIFREIQIEKVRIKQKYLFRKKGHSNSAYYFAERRKK